MGRAGPGLRRLLNPRGEDPEFHSFFPVSKDTEVSCLPCHQLQSIFLLHVPTYDAVVHSFCPRHRLSTRLPSVIVKRGPGSSVLVTRRPFPCPPSYPVGLRPRWSQSPLCPFLLPLPSPTAAFVSRFLSEVTEEGQRVPFAVVQVSFPSEAEFPGGSLPSSVRSPATLGHNRAGNGVVCGRAGRKLTLEKLESRGG